ncbi:conserved oligomeric Golgi complex subunit 2, putative [Babesia ovata]|uniref:Conserved oligomeric Golgi complex subunit 2, putative n=1 Tax=Babesia ovata TaxID=189622 RepID=A0A2H6K9U7_9APIC|nr:conserved oligomeric Golgi complex subunit 2, putative [Babesia ovata]GBE59767.1 conserved oligomeric Golgi complex subunit 2, putative [Babesia ovata]
MLTVKPKAEMADDAKSVELYNEAIEHLKSVSLQVKSPGEYVAARLESVSLDDIRRELKALLASCQSNASGILKPLVSTATPFNETIESTIQSLLPFKEVLKESAQQLDVGRHSIKQRKSHVKLSLCRFVMVSYAKMALATHLEAVKHLDNIAEEILDTFSTEDDTAIKNDANIVLRAIDALEKRTQFMEKTGGIVKSDDDKSNVTNDWAILEVIPSEINRIQRLLKQGDYYEKAITEYMNYYQKTLKEVDHEQLGLKEDVSIDPEKTNIENILEIEKLLQWNELEQFRSTYAVDSASKNVTRLHDSLIKLTDTCTKSEMTTLFTLYTERANLCMQDAMHANTCRKPSRDIATHVNGLCSLIKGGEQLRLPTAGSNNAILPFVDTFIQVFVKPILNTIVGELVQSEQGYVPLSPHGEANKFPNFVDMAVERLLHPQYSVAMQLLNDLAKASGSDKFKVICVFDGIAKELLRHIETQFSSIYFPIYVDRFASNLESYNQLIENIEVAAGSYRHYLKWRGSDIPNSVSRCFSVGAVCDNFIEHAARKLTTEIKINGNITGKVLEGEGQTFYMPPSMVLHRQLLALFNHRNFFYHLVPQYLRGASEMFAEYVKYLQSTVAKMESMYATESRDGTESGEGVTNAAYMLHDLDVIETAINSGGTESLTITLSTLPVDAREFDYGANFPRGANTWEISESEQSSPKASSASTSSGGTTSTHVSVDPSTPSQSPPNETEMDANSKDLQSALDSSNLPSTIVLLEGKSDGDVVKAAMRRLEYPLQVAFKRVSFAMGGIDAKDTSRTLTQRSRDLLDKLWKDAHKSNDSNGSQQNGDNTTDTPEGDVDKLPSEDLTDVKALITFTKTSVELLYNFFNSAHEQIEGLKYNLEYLVIQNLVSGATCSLQFLQSMPSKFRTGTKQDVSKPSNYVKYTLVPLLSFKEFTAPSIPQDLARKILTQTVARLSSEYRTQVLKLMQTVQNLNESLLNAKNVKVKEQGANYLIADLGLIRAQLKTDIAEFVQQCNTRMEIQQEHCEDLRLLSVCVPDDAVEA